MYVYSIQRERFTDWRQDIHVMKYHVILRANIAYLYSFFSLSRKKSQVCWILTQKVQLNSYDHNIKDAQSWQWVMVMGQMGQQLWVGHPPKVVDALTVDPFYIVLIRYLLWFSGSRRTSNGNRNCYFDCLLVPFHNLCNSVARDEQATSETHRFPWEDPNSVEILGKRLTDVN